MKLYVGNVFLIVVYEKDSPGEDRLEDIAENGMFTLVSKTNHGDPGSEYAAIAYEFVVSEGAEFVENYKLGSYRSVELNEPVYERFSSGVSDFGELNYVLLTLGYHGENAHPIIKAFPDRSHWHIHRGSMICQSDE